MKTQRRRRREGKSDYKARFSLLKSDKPRLVIRKTNRYIIVQLVDTTIAQDRVIAEKTSKELLKLGWPMEKAGSLKSLPAAYLTGFLLARKLKGKLKEAVLDIGLNKNVHGSRIYAALKGALDAGLYIPHNSKALPSIERIKSNKELSSLIEKVKEKI